MKKNQALNLYLLLAGLFVAALVTCNLIANKFIEVDLGFHTFIIPAGVLPYPLTFLVTELLSELYGRRKTNAVVIVGFVASMLVLGILLLAKCFPAISDSPVSDEIYNQVFANTWRVIGASMVAYLGAQLLDVKLFHFWKDLTQGKHLWLRNNASTIFSQLLDTTLVVTVLFAGQIPFNILLEFILHGWFFKLLCALLDTPILYLAVYKARKYFSLSANAELQI